ncbi:hypothetical protein A8B82_20275 [Sulfitobacter sp. EhC04]|uniref:GSCFA domain-containing protein n=1 Tax=Sulfitobacter sp. EhC04 TaxID=1849168 RepID=UPI0007F3BE08|nr:GSCFA domain-containing protein [Sulfitobacter sp. EhC04]OAN72278.1 hypothetical protein A8B82_20275 [Sulfitobacter sp. EhC04]
MTLMQNQVPENGAETFAATLKNKSRKYPDREDARYDDFQLLPDVYPGFRIDPSSSVFTIGSCFARNVEDDLLDRGVDVPTAHYSAAQDGVPGRKNRVLNQYNPGTMLQCVQTAFGEAPDGGIYPAGIGKVVDCLLSTGGNAVSATRAKERRAEIAALYRDGLAKSDTVVITLGLIETWKDTTTGLYLNEAPPMKLIKRHPEQFEFCRLDVAESVSLVSKMVELLTSDRQRNIVLTVSPVPLQVTFSGGDAVTANGYSKAVLRVVAETVTQKYGNVDYFPSYESVTTAGFRALGEDNVHVRPKIVKRIVNYMLDQYLEHAPAA